MLRSQSRRVVADYRLESRIYESLLRRLLARFGLNRDRRQEGVRHWASFYRVDKRVVGQP